MKSYIIFDLDGTLLNTIDDLATATNHALESLGYPRHGLWVYPTMVGNGVRKLMERAEPDADSITIDRLLAEFRAYYDDHCTDLTRPYPGIPELLSTLVSHGVAVAVTSNKYQAAVTKIINHHFTEIPFVAALGEVSGRPKKPDPSIVFAALSEHPTPKRDVLYVGDSAVDMETARRACVESVGVSWGFRTVSELRSAYADHIVSAPSDILPLAGIEQS